MSPSPHTRSSIPVDEQSALPSAYGVPAWAAVAIGALGTVLGIVIDHFAGTGELTARFAIIYVLACTVAALAVRHRALFTAVVQPPIILFIAVPVAYITFGTASLSIRSMALNVIPLVNRFPLMLFATTVVMTIGAIRLIRHRPRRAGRRAVDSTPSAGRIRAEALAKSPAAATPSTPDTAETVRIASPAAAARRRFAGTGFAGTGSAGTAQPEPGGASGSRGRPRPAASHGGGAGRADEPAASTYDRSYPDQGYPHGRTEQQTHGYTGPSGGGWLASVDPLAPGPDAYPQPRAESPDDDSRHRAEADRGPLGAARRASRRSPARAEIAAAGPHGPVRYRPESVGPRAGRADAEDVPAEPVFDDDALYAARRTRSGRRFQPEPRVPEHPIPSVRYRGEPPLGS